MPGSSSDISAPETGRRPAATGLLSRSRRILPWLGIILFLGLFFFYPLARILWLGLNPAALQGLDAAAGSLAFHSTLFTFYQAILSTALTLALGLPAAYLFARYSFPGKSFLRILTAIPFMLPTVVVAAGFNALLGPRGWINLGLMDLFHLQTPPITFVGTLGAILLAHVFYDATIAIRLVGNALAHLDPRLEQAARTLGADSRRVFGRVTLPLLRPSLLAAALLIFIFEFTSFGVILLLGGPHFSTLEVEIYKQAIQIFNLPLAGLLSLIQLLCTLGFSIIYSRLATRAAVASAPHAAESNLRRARTGRERLFVAGMCALLFVFYALPLFSLPLRSVTRLEADQGQRGQVSYGLTGEVAISAEWSLYTVTFTANETASDARIQFFLGARTGDVWIDDVQLVEHPPDVYRRDFDNGTVLLNGSRQKQRITAGPGYSRIIGDQAPRYQYIVDDASAAFSAPSEWRSVTYDSGEWKATPPFYHAWNGTCRQIDTPGGAAQWQLGIEEDDTYTVEAWWPAAPGAERWSRRVTYEVVAGGRVVASATLDQSTGGDEWHAIATVPLTAASAPLVRVRNEGEGPAIADALHVRSARRYNDGSAAANVTLQPMDGIILKRGN